MGGRPARCGLRCHAMQVPSAYQPGIFARPDDGDDDRDATGRAGDPAASLRRLPLQRDTLALVFACCAHIVVRRRACRPRAPFHQYVDVGAAGKGAGRFGGSLESDVQRSVAGRDAAYFLQTGALACVAFRRRCSAGLRMVGGRTKALKHGAPMRKHFQRRRDE
jgi:hypothetical protein